jgi:HK97 family phage major capsid protein
VDILEYTKPLREERMNLIGQVTAVYDEAIAAKRALDAEETQKVARMDERIAEIEAQVRAADEGETRAKDAATAREAFDRQYGTGTTETKSKSEADNLRAFLRGEAGRTLDIDLSRAAREANAIRQGADAKEVRALLWDTGSSGSLVPTILDRSLYQYLEATIAMFRMPTRKIQTAGGEPLQFPKLAAHAIATQVAGQGTALAGTDPTFGRMQLDAFKYGELVQVASEVVQDASIDIVSFVTEDVAYAVGRVIDTDLVVGSGSGKPMGVMTAALVGAAGTVATGGSLITPTYENLVDVVYSINDNYRNNGNCAWLMRDATAGNLRKLRDGAGGTVGAVLWNPSLTSGIQFGQPDRLLDFPVYTDPNVASLASSAKVLAFGDFSKYYIRQVGNFTFERSDDYAFNVDEIAFRGKWRVDGDVIDVTAINILKQAVA